MFLAYIKVYCRNALHESTHIYEIKFLKSLCFTMRKRTISIYHTKLSDFRECLILKSLSYAETSALPSTGEWVF
jgi:hypothetical protein